MEGVMDQDRREFIKDSMKGLMACCVIAQCPGLLQAGSEEEISEMDTYLKEVSKAFTYCTYRCSETCPLLVASLKGDQEYLDKQAKEWSEKHGGEKVPKDQRFCYGCKPIDKPLGFIVSRCTARQCAIEKKLGSCLECGDLATCDKELWTSYPQHREAVLKMQKEG